MRARDIFLALLVIGLGVFLTYSKSGRLDDITFGWDGRLFGLFDEFAYEETREIAGPIPAEVQVQNAHGMIEVSAAVGSDKASVIFKERVSARTKAEADVIADALRMVVTQTEGRLILATNRDEFRRKNFSTDFKIIVPAGTAVVLKNSYGPVRIEGTGKADITNPHGEVFVRGTGGSLTISTSYETVDVDGVKGDVFVSSPHANVDVRNIEGSVELDQSYGRIGLDRIGRKTIVKATHSRVTAQNLADDAEIASSYERISISGAKSVKVRAQHCDVEAKSIGGSFDLTDNYGHVRIDGLAGDLRIDGRNVGVAAIGLASGSIFVRTSYEDVALAGFTGPAEITLSHSGLALEPASGLSGTINVQGNYVDVRLAWPAGYRAPFEGRTKNGRIVWTLAEKPDAETSNGTTEILAFSSETGKPMIKIATAHGDIRVEAAGR